MPYIAYEVYITTFLAGKREYPVGSRLYLVCAVDPTPPADSEFSWKCSTGCFADKKVGKIVFAPTLNAMDSGSITCSLTVNKKEYHSKPFNLQVV